jgi:hypothetical protein
MIEERQRLVYGKRGQPQGETRDLHSGRIHIDPEQAALRHLAAKSDAVGGSDVRTMPTAISNEGFFRGLGHLRARRDEKCAAAHCRIENAQLQDLFRGLVGDERSQCFANDVGRENPRRVERARRLAQVACARQVTRVGLIVEDLFVDSAELFDIQIAVDDATASGSAGWRRSADGKHGFRHHVVVEDVAFERTGCGRSEEAPVESGHLQLTRGAPGMGKP